MLIDQSIQLLCHCERKAMVSIWCKICCEAHAHTRPHACTPAFSHPFKKYKEVYVCLHAWISLTTTFIITNMELILLYFNTQRMNAQNYILKLLIEPCLQMRCIELTYYKFHTTTRFHTHTISIQISIISNI